MTDERRTTTTTETTAGAPTSTTQTLEKGVHHGDEEAGGTLGGAVGGAVVGAVLGGPVGAVVGGAIGAATGATAGALDGKRRTKRSWSPRKRRPGRSTESTSSRTTCVAQRGPGRQLIVEAESQPWVSKRLSSSWSSSWSSCSSWDASGCAARRAGRPSRGSAVLLVVVSIAGDVFSLVGLPDRLIRPGDVALGGRHRHLGGFRGPGSRTPRLVGGCLG